MAHRTDTPELARIIAPLLARVPLAHQPLLIALAERMAAQRYRGWANDVSDGIRRSELQAAPTEEEIARRVETLTPDGATIQAAILASVPELADATRALFAGRSLEQQFAIQAEGERLGAATWRSFACQAAEPTARDVFLACAALEEASAAVLESFPKPIA
jgi:hypothetical protein